MKQAHQLARTFEGNYTACLAEALRIVWFDAKKLNKASFKASDNDFLISNIKDGKLYISFFRGQIHIKENETLANQLQEYAYKSWSTGEGMQFLFSSDFINNLNK